MLNACSAIECMRYQPYLRLGAVMKEGSEGGAAAALQLDDIRAAGLLPCTLEDAANQQRGALPYSCSLRGRVALARRRQQKQQLRLRWSAHPLHPRRSFTRPTPALLSDTTVLAHDSQPGTRSSHALLDTAIQSYTHGCTQLSVPNPQDTCDCRVAAICGVPVVAPLRTATKTLPGMLHLGDTSNRAANSVAIQRRNVAVSGSKTHHHTAR